MNPPVKGVFSVRVSVRNLRAILSHTWKCPVLHRKKHILAFLKVQIGRTRRIGKRRSPLQRGHNIAHNRCDRNARQPQNSFRGELEAEFLKRMVGFAGELNNGGRRDHLLHADLQANVPASAIQVPIGEFDNCATSSSYPSWGGAWRFGRANPAGQPVAPVMNCRGLSVLQPSFSVSERPSHVGVSL